MSRNARMAKMRSISSGFWINSWFCLLYNVSWLTETEMLGRVLGLILLRDPTIIWWIIITWPNATLTFCRGNGSVPFLKNVLNVILQPRFSLVKYRYLLFMPSFTFLIPEYQLSRENNETQTETPSPAIMGLWISPKLFLDQLNPRN